MHRPTHWRAIAILGAFVLWQGSATGHAQQVDLNQFRPSELATDGLAISTASDQGHLRVGAQLYLDYASDPLAFDRSNGERVRIVHQQLTAHAVVSLGLWSRLVLYAGIPYHALVKEKSGDNFPPLLAAGVNLPEGSGLGDIWTGARVRVLGTEQDIFQLALQGTLNIGTASMADSGQNYRGMVDRKARISGQPEVIGTFNALDGRIRVSLNTGIIIRHSSSIGNIVNVGDELTFGVGGIFGALRGTHALDVILEMFGRTGLSSGTGSSGFGDADETPLELLTGLKYHHERGFSAGLGGGLGLLDGTGAPAWRMLAMFGYTMPEKKPSAQSNATPVPVVAATIRGKDSDADGFTNSNDECPKAAEDFDNYEDSDGCPDIDNDADRIPDKQDQCPAEPEDIDGYQDADGCPDYDNDDDDLIDAQDQCPLQAGKKKYKGCPVTSDRDKDGVADDVDNCPDEAGSVANLGCKQKQLVEIQENRIQVLDKVYFATNSAVILKRSHLLLRNVASVLKAHPEIKLVQVEGHTDARGSADKNLVLSQQRAESVVRFLVKQGVNKNRLVAKGYGGGRPLLENATTNAELAQNRRVEFNILK